MRPSTNDSNCKLLKTMFAPANPQEPYRDSPFLLLLMGGGAQGKLSPIVCQVLPGYPMCSYHLSPSHHQTDDMLHMTSSYLHMRPHLINRILSGHDSFISSHATSGTTVSLLLAPTSKHTLTPTPAIPTKQGLWTAWPFSYTISDSTF